MNTAVSAVSAKKTPRVYSSPLRDRQAEQTRELILQALTEQLAQEGVQDFNMPRVARKAAVSVRTIYRHFPTKDALLDALEVWVDQRVLTWPRLEKAADLAALPERQFPIYDQHVALILAHLVSPAGQAVRAVGRRKRIEEFRAVLKEVTDNLNADDARGVLAVVSYLASGATWRSLRQEFGMTGEDAGRAVSGAIRLVIDDARKRNAEAVSSTNHLVKKKGGGYVKTT